MGDHEPIDGFPSSHVLRGLRFIARTADYTLNQTLSRDQANEALDKILQQTEHLIDVVEAARKALETHDS